MPSKVVTRGDRVFVNDDFVQEVRDLFPQDSFTMPLGWRVYMGRTAEDLLMFTSHSPIEGLKGQTYLMSTPSPNGVSYQLDRIEEARGQRRLMKAWQQGPRLVEAAVAPSGLYGVTRAVQGCCESAIRKLGRKATAISKRAVAADERVLGFLQRHAKRGSSKMAKLLLSAYQESLPKFAELENPKRTAGAAELGLYGMPRRVAKLGLQACSDLHDEIGFIGADLHSRKAALREQIVGFFGSHAKEAHCGYSRALAASYPEDE